MKGTAEDGEWQQQMLAGCYKESPPVSSFTAPGCENSLKINAQLIFMVKLDGNLDQRFN